MKIKILSFTLLTLIFFSCRKNSNEDSFPSETMVGKNTFGCYIDGHPFIAATTLFGQVRPVNVNYFPGPSYNMYKAGFLSVSGIDARSSLSVAGIVSINKLDIFGVGEYSLIDRGDSCGANYTCDDIGYHNDKTGQSFAVISGKLTITKLDTLNKIASGRFYFTAMDKLGNKVEITDGRFDAKYTN